MTCGGRGGSRMMCRRSVFLCGGCLFLISAVVTATRTISEAPVHSNHSEVERREMLKETRRKVDSMWIKFGTSHTLGNDRGQRKGHTSMEYQRMGL